jgi:hypothetical protein
MKRLVLTFVWMAAVCTVVSAGPAAAQDTVTGAPAGTAPVTVEGYEHSSEHTAASAPAVGAAKGGSAYGIVVPERCHVTRDREGSEGRYTVICGP